MEGWRANRVVVAAGLAAGLVVAGGALGQPDGGKPAEPPATKAEPPKAEPAKGAKLKVGDKAPELAIETWVKGDPVTGFEKGRVYVVEFWATWCPPCRESIPHLTEMAKAHKKDGVTFIGVTSTDKDLETVKKFVDKMGDKMDYTVAVDKGSFAKKATMNETWMEAAEQDGIPTAFIVDKDQKIAWIGHPMDGLDKVLGQVVAGKFDAKKHAEDQAKKQKAMDELRSALMGEEWEKATKLLDEMIAAGGDSAKMFSMIKFQMLLMGKKDAAAASKHAEAMLTGILKDDAEGLNQVAWTILDAPGVEKRDFDLALKIAQKACELSKHENGMILDTLARAYFEKGDLAKAVEWQTKAVEKANGPEEMKAEMKETLEKYKAEQAKKDKK